MWNKIWKVIKKISWGIIQITLGWLICLVILAKGLLPDD